MRSAVLFLCAFSLWHCSQGTYRPSTRCNCNGKALYCVRDSLGLRCEKCQENTEGRHCESCKQGYYHQRAGESCLPCNCNTIGSAGPGCTSQGECVCKPGVQGAKCDRCNNGTPITSNGCEKLRQRTCFCNGHSNECSPAQGYSLYNITSTFDQGSEGWSAVTEQSGNPSKVHLHWSPIYRQLEVISTDVLPIYLSAPATYLGNQVMSYGRSLSFSLRLDRGNRYPSNSDIVLEGAGLRVSASLGDPRTPLPCGRKITHSFRLDEKPGSKWRPQLSSSEFQKLLSKLTAIKIRGTFGENGRGYLDDVTLGSARLGSGTPAGWVEMCRCPAGYEGQFCERCASGYKRRFPDQGPSSPCERCNCVGGSCDPEIGDCYPADETINGLACPVGYYTDPRKPGICITCPCQQGYVCSVTSESLEVRCDCPHGTTGTRCQRCDDGFFGDPLGESGIQRPCRRCQCNDHLDPNAVGNCDRLSGECLKCLNNTAGFFCQNCVEGFYHAKPTDACQACNCNPQGSLSASCSDQGQCTCKDGFDGQKCKRTTCPSCFNPVKNQIEKYAKKLQELETLFNGEGSGDTFVPSSMEDAIMAAEDVVKSLESSAGELNDTEASLQAKLTAVASSQLSDEIKLRDISVSVDRIVQQEQQFSREVAAIRDLISEIRRNLQKAKQGIAQIEFPLRDEEGSAFTLSGLVQKATDLANTHQSEAGTVEQTAKNALMDAEKALVLMRSIVGKENSIKEQVNGLTSLLEKDVALVDSMQKQATRLSDAALAESMTAMDALKQISDLENNLLKAPENDVTGLAKRLEGMKDLLASNVSAFQELQKNVQANQTEIKNLMDKVKNAQQVEDQLLARANAAKADAEQALKSFKGLDGVDQVLDKLRGFEEQINTNKALALDALNKLPTINATIQQAANNNKNTQAILDNLTDFSDALENFNKLNNTLAKLEKASASLPPSADTLKTATSLNQDLEGLKSLAQSTMNQLKNKKKNAELERKLAEEADQHGNEALDKAANTRSAVGDTLKTVNQLLDLIGKPGSVDETKVAELEREVTNSRGRVEQELRPRLHELERRDAQQRDAVARLIADIDTILTDIENLEQIRRSLPEGCYNAQPRERP